MMQENVNSSVLSFLKTSSADVGNCTWAAVGGVAPVAHSMLAKRYEFKYRIPESTAVAIRSYIQGFVRPDPYMAGQMTDGYVISSLYFDSPQFHLFNETQLDKCNRFKLRIRGYDDNPDGCAFFEIKRKLNQIVYKSRARVAKAQIAPILYNHYSPADLSEKDHNCLWQFVHYVQCLRAHPIVLVRYRRQAFEGLADAKVRITFDRELSYQPAEQAAVKVNGPGWQKLPIDFVVLEIKFTSQFPTWVKMLVRTFNLQRQSMSKYCSSAQCVMDIEGKLKNWGQL